MMENRKRPCRTARSSRTWLALVILMAHLTVARASGYFELELVELHNAKGTLASGKCCGARADTGATPDDACRTECSTFFRLCLKEYQSSVTLDGRCSYGNQSSPVVAGNSFTFVEPLKSNARLAVNFTFRWTKSFTLVLEALDYDNATKTGGEIERAVYSGLLDPSADWHSLTHEGSRGLRLTYRVRVQCDANYYSADCGRFCRPRNDTFGHYTCDKHGNKTCLPGWKGENCDVAICKPGCHEIHGRCDKPGECTCQYGWQGELCDQCSPYPGCKHGYCKGSPWQCICETNWGGLLCDQDLNYCGTHEPCKNGGTCESPAPDEYVCKCAEGFSGVNCEVADNICATGPCANGGSCSVIASTLNNAESFKCSCRPGWTGETCQTNVDECQSSPCANGATCVDMENGYRCQCAEGWHGDHCDQDVNECLVPEKCRNSVGCDNAPGNYTCHCVTGFYGKQCDLNVNDCEANRCANGATCIDLIDAYHCACPAGFGGRYCELNVDECASGPCANGGECVDLVNGYRCICPLGYTGAQCQTDTDLCHPNPCANGAPCINTLGNHNAPDYYCLCPANWHGKNCSKYRPPPPPSTPSTPDRTETSVTCRTSSGDGPCVHGRCSAAVQDGRLLEQCVCESGYTGPFCSERKFRPVKDEAWSGCEWSGRLYPEGSSWDDNCNKCQCRLGRPICTRVWCGPANCLNDPLTGGATCGPSEVCMATQSGCLTPPCPAYGQCTPLKPGRITVLPPTTASCWPNLTGSRLAPTCARMNLLVDRYKAQAGLSVQTLCTHLRKLAAAQSHLWDSLMATPKQSEIERPSLVILCDLKDKNDDVVQVTVSMAESSTDIGGSRASAAARALGDMLKAHYREEGSYMSAIVNVKVETPDQVAEPLEGASSSGFVASVVCAVIAGLAVVVGLLVLFAWRVRKRPQHAPAPAPASHDHRSIEKSNNLQNEENLRLQQRRMKTLNVSELVDAKKMAGDDERPPLPVATGRCPDAIESSPIYKAPISVDVRNNIHLAARAGQMVDKELSLKVVVV